MRQNDLMNAIQQAKTAYQKRLLPEEGFVPADHGPSETAAQDVQQNRQQAQQRFEEQRKQTVDGMVAQQEAIAEQQAMQVARRTPEAPPTMVPLTDEERKTEEEWQPFAEGLEDGSIFQGSLDEDPYTVDLQRKHNEIEKRRPPQSFMSKYGLKLGLLAAGALTGGLLAGSASAVGTVGAAAANMGEYGALMEAGGTSMEPFVDAVGGSRWAPVGRNARGVLDYGRFFGDHPMYQTETARMMGLTEPLLPASPAAQVAGLSGFDPRAIPYGQEGTALLNHFGWRAAQGAAVGGSAALARMANNAAGADLSDVTSRSMKHLVDVAHNTDRANQTPAPLVDYNTANGMNSLAPAIGSGIDHRGQALLVQPQGAPPHEWGMDADHYDRLRQEVRTRQNETRGQTMHRHAAELAHNIANMGSKPRRRAPKNTGKSSVVVRNK
jgi:hypothetical protein